MPDISIDFEELCNKLFTDEVQGTVRKIGMEHLSERKPIVQALILADLIAVYLCGFDKNTRPMFATLIEQLVKELIPYNEKMISDAIRELNKAGETQH
jgi:hypothetical protein